MTYQRCRYNSTVEKIPIHEIGGQSYILLNDVRDRFPDVTYFKYDNNPIPFEHDDKHDRLVPERIKAHTEIIIDCYKPMDDDQTASKFDCTQQAIFETNQIVKQTNETVEIIKANITALLRQTFELAEFTTPRLFIILPDYTSIYNPSHWLHLNYRLYFLCECERDEQRHFAYHEGYKIKRPREFLRKFGPHLTDMLKVIKYTRSVSQFFVPRLSHVASGISTLVTPKHRLSLDNLDMRLEWLGQCLKEVEKSQSTSVDREIQPLEGAALHEIESFLKQTEKHSKFGNLSRSVDNDGHVRWLCTEHHRELYRKNTIKILHAEFRKLGGEIEEDVACIEGKASEKFPEILEVLKKGLSLFTVVLKDLSVKESHFDDLLSFLSRQSTIRNLQLENISLLSNYIAKKPSIISKLDETLIKNDNLRIEFSSTKSLKRLATDTIDIVAEANSRLIFQLRSKKDSSSLELIGSKDTGFTLTINNSSEQNDINYHTVISKIFSVVPNIIKVFLHNGVISENIWISFRDYLTKPDCLQELTIDCQLTMEQMELLYNTLSDSKALKMLHITKHSENKNDLVGCENIFRILEKNSNLIEFTLKSSNSYLHVDFDEFNIQPNGCHRRSCSVKCQIHQMTNVELFENFLQDFSIHRVSLKLIDFHSEEFIQRLVSRVDKNKNIEILELKSSDCFAIYHRQENDILSSETKSICPSFASARTKSTKCFGFFSHQISWHFNHSHEKFILRPVVLTPKNPSESFSVESLDQSYDRHPPLYKKVQIMMKNWKLNELEVTIGAFVKMTSLALSIEFNRTLMSLGISIRRATADDLRILAEALRRNTTITHLTLHEVRISVDNFRPIFDVLRSDRTLRVLVVEHSISHSDRDLFMKEIEELKKTNPSLEIVYHNS